jgi:hypothetical protein
MDGYIRYAPRLLRDSQTSLSHYPAQNMLVFRKRQICWDSPERTIHCLLTKVSRQREADARVIESVARGLTHYP